MSEGSIKELSFLKKLENIWFYYKWYFLAAILIFIFIAVGVKQCNEAVQPDMGVLFVTSKKNNFTAATAEEIGIFIENKYMTDYNGDGNIKCNVVQVALDLEYFDDDQATQRQNLLINLGNNENFIIICDDECYNYLYGIEMSNGVKTGVFEPVKNYISDAAAEELRISLNGTGLGNMEALSQTELFMSLRLYNESGAEGNEKATDLFNYSCEIANKIVNDKTE